MIIINDSCTSKKTWCLSLLLLCWALGWSHHEYTCPIWELSQITIVLWVLRMFKPHWLSKLDVLGAGHSSADLKSCGVRSGVQTLYSSGRSLELWAPSWLWVTMLGVVRMVRLSLSLSYRFRCGCFHVCLMWRSRSARFGVSFRGNCSIWSCRFTVSLSGGEFRIFLCHHLEPLWSAHIYVQAGLWIPAFPGGAVILLAWDAGNLGFLFFQIITSSGVLPLASVRADAVI